MKKRFFTSLAVLMIFALIMSFAAPVSTAVTNTPVTGPAAVYFKKYLVIPEDAHVPNTTITFNIAPGTAKEADATHMAVYAGPQGATVNTVTFTPADTTYNTVQSGDTLTLPAGKIYAKQTATINLSAVTFTEPGVYRFALTEVSSTDTAVGLDANPLYLDVYVTSNAEGVLTVNETVLHTNDAAPVKSQDYGSGDVATTGTALADKVDGFVNEYPTGTLSFSKAVAGNQASRDKYFAVTVTISGVTAGNAYNVDYTTGSADATIAKNPNAATTIAALNGAADYVQPASITVPAGATTVTQVFYLKHGQTISINGLPIGAGYTVLEDEEDYKPATVVTGDKLNGTDTSEAVITANHQAAGTIDEDDANTIAVAFTNTRDGIIPTGVIMAVAPFAIGMLLFGAIIIFIISKKKKAAFYEE